MVLMFQQVELFITAAVRNSDLAQFGKNVKQTSLYVILVYMFGLTLS
jgi:hypothetical protein